MNERNRIEQLFYCHRCNDLAQVWFIVFAKILQQNVSDSWYFFVFVLKMFLEILCSETSSFYWNHAWNWNSKTEMEEKISMYFLYEGWIWCRRIFYMQLLWFKWCYNIMTFGVLHRCKANFMSPKEVFSYAGEKVCLQNMFFKIKISWKSNIFNYWRLQETN